MEEQIDVVSPATGQTEATMSRAQVHAGGHWHQVFHCLVIQRNAGTIVLQRRSESSSAFPGKLDLSVTGHLIAGEKPVDGVREAEEELGVSIDANRLVKVGTRLLALDDGDDQHRELVHLFFLADDRPLDAFSPPIEEVSGLVQVGVDDLLLILDDPEVVRPATEFTSTGGFAAVEMTREDLVDGSSSYWVSLAVAAKRFIDNESPLAI